MNGDADNLASDDSLDDAIRQAMQIDVSEQQLAHLQQYWRVQSQRDRWRRNARRIAVAVAASVALLATAAVVWHGGGQQHETAQIIPDSANRIVESNRAEQPHAEHATRIEPSELPGRAPTAYEQLVFAAQSGIATHPKLSATAIDEAVQRVAANADADPAKVIDSLGIRRVNAEALLLRRLPRTPESQLQATLRMLAGCGSLRSVPALLRLAQKEPLRSEALSTLEKIVGIDGLVQTVGNSSNPNVRAALIRRLLTADSEAALLGYLSLVRNDATRVEALSVAKSIRHAPVEHLITLLDHPEEPVRVATAITLGHINGPTTTQMLIARVTEQPANSREAWLALMECRGEKAREFLAYATRRPHLLGYYNNARVHWEQSIQ